MDDNVLFKQQKLQPLQQQPAATPPGPSQNPPVSPTPPTPPPPSPAPRSSSSLKRLLFGVIAVVIVTVLVIIFFPRGQEQKVKIVWWGLWEDAKVIEPIIADFERENPTIDVEYSKQDPKQYRERLATRISLGTGPDVFRFHNTWYPMLSDILLPLPSDVMTQEDFKKNYYPVMQTDLVHNGGIYGIPLGADTISLFVNTELLEAAGVSTPTTWEDFVTAAKTLTVKNEDGTIQTAGAALGTYGNITHASDIVSVLFVQQGVDMQKISASPQDEADALDFYTSFAKSQTNTWDSTLDQSLLSFSQGKLAMYFGYSWDIFSIQRLNKDLAFKIYPVPSLFNRNMTIASYWVEGVSSKTTHQKEALHFMRYLARKETAQKLYTEASKTRAFGQPYARVDLAETLKDNELVYPFVAQLKNAKSTLFSSDTSDGEGGLNSLSNVYLGNAINAIIVDNSSSQSEIDTVNQGVAQALSKYGIQ
jgi:multiple sugar transport system substrate-binding protein